MAPLVIAVVGVLLISVAVVSGSGLLDDTGDDTAGGEIFLETAASLGQSPFTEALDPEPTTTTTAATPPSLPVAQPTSGVVPPDGSPPYGGRGDDTTCDREAMISFLAAAPDRAQAWAGVLGVEVDAIPTYVRSLVPTVLAYDTRVTNHGYADGRATPFQSVLQAGTAVLVDPAGSPVVRCRCGNPLAPPAEVPRPTFVGIAWPGFAPTAVVTATNGLTTSVVIEVTPPSPTSVPRPAETGPSTTTGQGEDRIAGLIAVVEQCAGGAPVEVVDVADDPQLPNTVTARLVVDGTEMLFTYDVATGTVGEGDRASAEFLRACGVVP